MIDVSDGSDIRKLHHSGYLGSTLDYLCRFKSQQAYWADCGTTYRASIRDEKGRRRGIKSPITGKRWGCTRNISPRAVEAHFTAKTEARAATRLITGNSGTTLLMQRENSEAARAAREAA